jgi:hypothetical protein
LHSETAFLGTAIECVWKYKLQDTPSVCIDCLA